MTRGIQMGHVVSEARNAKIVSIADVGQGSYKALWPRTTSYCLCGCAGFVLLRAGECDSRGSAIGLG
jgi:hypothetical protein